MEAASMSWKNINLLEKYQLAASRGLQESWRRRGAIPIFITSTGSGAGGCGIRNWRCNASGVASRRVVSPRRETVYFPANYVFVTFAPSFASHVASHPPSLSRPCSDPEWTLRRCRIYGPLTEVWRVSMSYIQCSGTASGLLDAIRVRYFRKEKKKDRKKKKRRK